MKELILNKKTIAYSYIFEPKFSKEEIIDSIEKMISTMPYVKSDAYVFNKSKDEFKDVYDFCKNMCIELCKIENLNCDTIRLHKWISILRNNPKQPMELDIENNEPTYHNHHLIAKMSNREIPTYSFVYYLQMPDNLSGIDGQILFKDDIGVLNYLPKENEILIFKSDVPHAPIHAKNSTKNRMVLAGDFIILNQSKNKTII